MSLKETVRKSELASLKSSLSEAGSTRCILITGEKGIGKTHLISRLGNSYPKLSDYNVWTQIDGSSINSPMDFCSSFVRSLSAGDGVSPDSLNLLAREFGKQSVLLDRERLKINNEFNFDQNLAKSFIQLLEERFGAVNSQLSRYMPVLCIDNLDRLAKSVVDWFVGPFNQAIRKSGLFKRARFLFSAKEYNDKLQGVFDRFGLDRVRRLKLQNLNASQCHELNKQTYNRKITSTELIDNSKGNPLKLLNFLRKYTIYNKEDIKLDTQSPTKVLTDLSGFSEKEIERLSFAAYPDRINRYNLEFFSDSRDAAFCFNWLKRNSKLCTTADDGDLVLRQDIRDAVFSHCEFENSELHEKNKIKSTILSAYLNLFPNPNEHWIPVNLAVFDCFNRSLIENIFEPLESEEILGFIDEHPDQFIKNNSQICLTDDAKLVTQRFTEIGGGQPIDGIKEKALVQWENDLESIRKKKIKLEQEKINIGEEVAGIEKQISHFNGLKEQIVNAINKPRASNKPRKEITFSVSKLLVVIGLVTIALSLISSLFGTYHAAIGIALTLFGFFWPSVQIKRANMADQGLNPKLALETQQHSVEHRINGLTSRASTLNNSLVSITDMLTESDDDTLVPYVSEKQDSEE